MRVPVWIWTFVATLTVGTSLVFSFPTVASGAWTFWDCENSSYACDPGGCFAENKYSRNRMEYTVLGGLYSSTDWRVDTGSYGGSKGCTGISWDWWRRDSWSIWSYRWDTGTVYETGGGSGGNHTNNAPWESSSVGNGFTKYDAQGIHFLVGIKHHACNAQGGSCHEWWDNLEVWAYIP
jgi:hypothetical protein